MAKVEGLNQRGSRWYVKIIVPDDLHETYGKSRVNPSLGTSDRKEAVLLATLKRAEWLADFEAKRSQANPEPLSAITPVLAKLLAARVRASVLASDDRVRNDLSLLAEMVHVRKELVRRKANPLQIPQWEPSTPRIDDLTGATEEERNELAGLNAYLDGGAAVALAGRNLAVVLPLVRDEAAMLGFSMDAKTPGTREALLACLSAYRTAHRELTQRDAGDVVETPIIEASMPTVVTAPKTLRDVYDRWAVSGEEKRTIINKNACNSALELFEGFAPDTTLEAITRNQGDAFRAWLRDRPGASKTARGKLTYVKSLLKFACQTLEWIPKHPWVGLEIKAATESPRRPWAAAELEKLFSSPVHTAYLLPTHWRAGGAAAYWIPLLGLFTGARMGELCQLRTADVQAIEGIPVLVITDNGEGQQIKSRAGRRTLPLHSELLRLGFLEYVQAMRAAGEDALWPTLRHRLGKPSGYYSEWFSTHRKAQGLTENRPDFHCFRHTVRPLMRRAGFSESTMDKITGHENGGSIGSVVYDHFTLEEIQKAIEAIQYPALVLPRLLFAIAPVASTCVAPTPHGPS